MERIEGEEKKTQRREEGNVIRKADPAAVNGSENLTYRNYYILSEQQRDLSTVFMKNYLYFISDVSGLYRKSRECDKVGG